MIFEGLFGSGEHPVGMYEPQVHDVPDKYPDNVPAVDVHVYGLTTFGVKLIMQPFESALVPVHAVLA